MDKSQVVGMPAFNDPSNPEAAAGSVNFPLEDHPVKHHPEYGKATEQILADEDGQQFVTGEDGYVEKVADRVDWTKQDWKDQAAAYGLPVGGNLGEVRDRVNAHEEEGS